MRRETAEALIEHSPKGDGEIREMPGKGRDDTARVGVVFEELIDGINAVSELAYRLGLEGGEDPDAFSNDRAMEDLRRIRIVPLGRSTVFW